MTAELIPVPHVHGRWSLRRREWVGVLSCGHYITGTVWRFWPRSHRLTSLVPCAECTSARQPLISPSWLMSNIIVIVCYT